MSQLKPRIHHFFIRPEFITFSSLFHQTRIHHFFITCSSPLGMRKIEDVSAETSNSSLFHQTRIHHFFITCSSPLGMRKVEDVSAETSNSSLFHQTRFHHFFITFSSDQISSLFHHLFITLRLRKVEDVSAETSVHKANPDIPHKWAQSIGPTGLIPADHGDKRSHYVLI